MFNSSMHNSKIAYITRGQNIKTSFAGQVATTEIGKKCYIKFGFTGIFIRIDIWMK